MIPRRTFNPKRQIRSQLLNDEEKAKLRAMADRARYGGNPEHKRNPGDFGLQPPSSPRQGKTLCDAAEIFQRREAQDLLREGFRRGLVSARSQGDWPKYIWAVAPNGVSVEAILENQVIGSYHGYPMSEADPLSEEVSKRWTDG